MPPGHSFGSSQAGWYRHTDVRTYAQCAHAHALKHARVAGAPSHQVGLLGNALHRSTHSST
jgi:hypothetical protein